MQLNENLIIAPIKSAKSGQPGPMGPKGEKGDPGKDGLPPAHQWVATALRFKNPDDTWGALVNLKGEKGDPGEDSKIEVQDETGGKGDLRTIKYNSKDPRIKYDSVAQSIEIRSTEHIYQLDWTVNSEAELPRGPAFIGVVIYNKDKSEYIWYDGTDWKPLLSGGITPESLFGMLDNGTWGDAHLTPTKDKIVIDSKNAFLGVFNSLSDLEASPLKKVNGKSFAVVRDSSGGTSPEIERLYVYVGSSWSPMVVNGNILFEDGGVAKPVTHLKAGDNVTMDYDSTKNELTINSAGPGTPTDLSKYVKGENVRTTAGGWLDVSWNDSSKILDIEVPKPDYDKMNSVVVAGDNISFEKDPVSGLLKIGANFHPDFTPYVRGQGITSNDGLTTSWDRATQQLTVGYSPSYTDLQKLIEAGDNITVEKGTGEKLKISSVGTPTDLSEYVKKANVKIPTGYWGTVEVDGDDVNLKVGLTIDQFAGMFSDTGDLNVAVENDKVKFTTKDGRKRLYSVLAKTVSGNPPMIKAGRHIHLELDDVARTIQIDSTAREFDSSSVSTSLPLTSTWDGSANTMDIQFDLSAFVNTASDTGNVKLTYDAVSNKVNYNVDKSVIPNLAIKKDTGNSESLGTLQILNAGSALDIQNDPDNPGKKLAILTMHDKYEVTGHANGKDQKLTDLTVRSDIADQVVFLNGNMMIDLNKGHYVGRVSSTSDLPAKAVADKSFGYVKSADGVNRQYLYDGTSWNQFTPVSGMLLTDGTTNQVVTQIKNNSAVTFSNGELTINQTGVVYKNNGSEGALHSLEVTGAGVSSSFNSATGELKLDIPGAGTTVQTPLKVNVINVDGSVTEFADTREINLSGDVGGIVGEDIPFGGKKITMPIGILVETNATETSLYNKYTPSKFKGRLAFSDSSDSSLRKWFGCDGDKWFVVTSESIVTDIGEILSRMSPLVKSSVTADASKDKTAWTFLSGGSVDSPEYTRDDGSKAKVDGFLMNMTDGKYSVQVFYPASEFTYPQYRQWDSSKWSEWIGFPTGGGSGGGGDVDAHNHAEDAHEAIILPAVVATTQCTWFDITEGQAVARLKNVLPMMLLSDSSGRADVIDSPTGTDLYSVVVPRTGTYNLKWVFQITGIDTAHGTVRFSILKNGTSIHDGSISVATAGGEFPAYELVSADQSLSKGDHISVRVEYTGDTSWTTDQKKDARVDAMKNYLVIEHKDSKSGSQIAKTFRSILGGFVAKPGFEAVVSPDHSDPSIATLVEVTGSEYSVDVESVK